MLVSAVGGKINSVGNLTSSYDVEQLISESTQLLHTLHSSVFSSIHKNYHHQIFYASLNLNMFYPLPCTRRTLIIAY